MPGPLPKPDGERRRTGGGLGWTELPATPRTEPAPELPPGDWPNATRVAWASLWALPVARAWEPSGATLHGWAEVRRIIDEGKASAALYGELRQIEDRHGVSPAAALRCRFRFVDAAEVARPATPARKGPRRDPRLRMVGRGA